MKDSTSVDDVEDERKKRPPGNQIASFDHNKMLRNKNLQDENQEDINLLGCKSVAAFKSKLETHFITYFEQQDVNS
eukprot:9135346-Ditylum_brightwellii.AAC.1